VVASDGSVGGFCHAWGEEKPEVRRKKRMLEEEGVVFDDEGGGGKTKIRREFFAVGSSASSSSPDSTRKSKTAPEVVCGRREVENAPSKSKYFATTGVGIEEVLKREILTLLQEERRVGKTC
jgi:hypothetical protein